MKPSSIEWVEQCESTNTMMKDRAAAIPHGHVIAAHSQTAGRGQRGNCWESAPAMNLTYSQMLRPTAMDASRQFELSMLTSLAILGVLRRRMPIHPSPSGDGAQVGRPGMELHIFPDLLLLFGKLLQRGDSLYLIQKQLPLRLHLPNQRDRKSVV